MATWIFWLSAALVWYAYAGYPLLLWAITSLRRRPPLATVATFPAGAAWPTLTMIVPAHNERANIEAKIANTATLVYPEGRLEVLYVSDGSTDGTADAIRARLDGRSRLLELTTRGGKAAALNRALSDARHEIIVFNDAAIQLAPDALTEIAAPFVDPAIGCVSGEDRIEGSGGEALYGRYELFMRRQESALHSIVGASGSFYAQRRTLCEPFVPNLAPDFLSVLNTVSRGSRAVSQATAVGAMAALDRAGDEFQRKVRTLLRGLTTLGHASRLMNPFRYGYFAFALISHKLVRWLVPFALLAMLAANVFLAIDSVIYRAILVAQVLFYLLAVAGLAGFGPVAGTLPAKVAVYFTASNAAVLAAWAKYVVGVRQEIWSPSKRGPTQ